MLNGRKTIGIILFDITGYYQQQLVHTLSKTASKRGYNLLTFSAFTAVSALECKVSGASAALFGLWEAVGESAYRVVPVE